MQPKQYVLRESIDIARPRFQETYARARIQRERISQMQFSRKKARSNGFLNGSRAGGRERIEPRFIERSKMSIVPPLRINEIDYN